MSPHSDVHGFKMTLLGAAGAVLLLGAAVVGFAPAASAGSSGYGTGYGNDDHRTVPNVPDRNGCVKLCELDLNPCDPPLYKKVDGRCTIKD